MCGRIQFGKIFIPILIYGPFYFQIDAINAGITQPDQMSEQKIYLGTYGSTPKATLNKSQKILKKTHFGFIFMK